MARRLGAAEHPCRHRRDGGRGRRGDPARGARLRAAARGRVRPRDQDGHRGGAAALHRRRRRCRRRRRLPPARGGRVPGRSQPRRAAVGLPRRRAGRLAEDQRGGRGRRCLAAGAAQSRRGDVRVHRPHRRGVGRGLRRGSAQRRGRPRPAPLGARRDAARGRRLRRRRAAAGGRAGALAPAADRRLPGRRRPAAPSARAAV